MMNVPEKIKSVTHPLISSIYLKKDYGASDVKDVLVIETNFEGHDPNDYHDFDSYLMELLGDLNDLREQAEGSVGHFDRIDIRS